MVKIIFKDLKAGVSGIICVDLPWPENKNFAKKCKEINKFYSTFSSYNNKR